MIEFAVAEVQEQHAPPRTVRRAVRPRGIRISTANAEVPLPKTWTAGERIAWGVLCQAVLDARLKFADPDHPLAEDAWEWFNSDDTRYLLSFHSICNILNFDPDYVRRCANSPSMGGNGVPYKIGAIRRGLPCL